MTRRVIGIAGWKNSGKTTLVERLVAELTRRGRIVSTIKHAHHNSDVDRKGTDTFRHRKAGAREVMLVTANRWALMHELQAGQEPPLDAMLERLSPCDVVIVEGYKDSAHPKIEVRRAEAKDRSPLPQSAHVVAIASDHPVEEKTIPVFALDDVGPIADFIEKLVGLEESTT